MPLVMDSGRNYME